ncbi:DUF4861 family protein [Flavivirga sp. 57AJ16]|uniref:DUF4861 family protein n=1 Tax=Flavivirga sp. 57AJ16 TaxID=3025307 RepID=UPI0023666207|nr:DUF4861 family protein [Flavivirga sp. 57AJ16]MDD7887558.1 DUF4861 family protein [Flavivirga sp. 57AJ16]
MNSKIVLGALALTVIVACKEKENKNVAEEIIEIEEVQPATYAEISVKEGGSWKEDTREYIGGSFVNVDEMEVPEQHTDHSWYIRYEGPGWENKQIAYRLYLDWRNAIDIFGKKVDTLVLPYVGTDGFNSYHNDAPWGQDILKAGRSMGIGGYGRFTGDTIAHFDEVENTLVNVDNSTASSSVTIDYQGWKTGDITTDLKSVISIFPEDRFLKVELTPSVSFDGLATGIVKFDDIPLMEETSENGDWAYIATYGVQTLAGENDKLGMAIFYKIDQANAVEGPYDHLVVFNPSKEKHIYYIHSAWDQEQNGIKTEEAFKQDLQNKLSELDNNGKLE